MSGTGYSAGYSRDAGVSCRVMEDAMSYHENAVAYVRATAEGFDTPGHKWCRYVADMADAAKRLEEALRHFLNAPSGQPICACRKTGNCAYCIARAALAAIPNEPT